MTAFFSPEDWRWRVTDTTLTAIGDRSGWPRFEFSGTFHFANIEELRAFFKEISKPPPPCWVTGEDPEG